MAGNPLRDRGAAIRQVIDADTSQIHLVRQAIETGRARGAISAAVEAELMRHVNEWIGQVAEA